MKRIKKEDRKILLKAQQGELDAVLMYKALAAAVKNKHDAAVFRQLAAEEGHHAAVFRSLTRQNLKPKKTMAIILPILYKVLGKRKLYPLIAKGEYSAVKTYAPVAAKFAQVKSIKKDEKRHGDTVMKLL
ncbi:MAG: rubrerythrin [Clostridia bacterium]|nr:rubrerythrin [Clostridia bacterium]